MLDYDIKFFESTNNYQKALITKKYEDQSVCTSERFVLMNDLNDRILKLIGEHDATSTENVMVKLSNNCITIEYYVIFNKKSGSVVKGMTAKTKYEIDKWINNYNVMIASNKVVSLFEYLINNKVENVDKYLNELFETNINESDRESELLENTIIQFQNIINMSFPYETFNKDELIKYQNSMLFVIFSSYKEYKRDRRINIKEAVEKFKTINS